MGGNVTDRRFRRKHELALRLLKDAAIHARDIDSLAMAIRVILRRGEQGAVYEAFHLLEKLYTCTNECAGQAGKTASNISMILGNEKYARTVTILFEEILKASKNYGLLLKLINYIVILMCYGGTRGS